MGQDLAQRYGKEAGNVSPPLEEDAPQGTRSFALALVDIDPMARNYVHWLGSRGGPPNSMLMSASEAGIPMSTMIIAPALVWVTLLLVRRSDINTRPRRAAARCRS